MYSPLGWDKWYFLLSLSLPLSFSESALMFMAGWADVFWHFLFAGLGMSCLHHTRWIETHTHIEKRWGPVRRHSCRKTVTHEWGKFMVRIVTVVQKHHSSLGIYKSLTQCLFPPRKGFIWYRGSISNGQEWVSFCLCRLCDDEWVSAGICYF